MGKVVALVRPALARAGSAPRLRRLRRQEAARESRQCPLRTRSAPRRVTVPVAQVTRPVRGGGFRLLITPLSPKLGHNM